MIMTIMTINTEKQKHIIIMTIITIITDTHLKHTL